MCCHHNVAIIIKAFANCRKVTEVVCQSATNGVSVKKMHEDIGGELCTKLTNLKICSLLIQRQLLKQSQWVNVTSSLNS